MKVNILSVILGISMLAITTTSVKCQQAQNEPPHETAAMQVAQLPEGSVPTSFVCFVNNTYMGKEQIPVEVNGKTYYGCCNGCIAQLQNNRQIRYDKDPLSGNEVDKATAYIVVKPGAEGGVWYFESEQNYKQYLQKM